VQLDGLRLAVAHDDIIQTALGYFIAPSAPS
jgi:EamA domain-containing membrane protein RarD